MFGRLKGAVSGAVSKAKGAAGGGRNRDEERAERERIAKEEKEAKELEKQEHLQMKLLPWNFADYVKMALFLVIKLPFILSVGILATFIELQVGSIDSRSWHRPTTSSGPSCFITELTKEIMNYNTTLNELGEKYGFGQIYNESNLVVGNQSRIINYTFTDSDRCGIVKDKCEIDKKEFESGDMVEDHGWFGFGAGGIGFGAIFPFALLWMLYKLVWIPLWPVDRLALKFAGDQYPPPQPVFRLVTQPYFQVCSGFCQVVMMILNMLRYVFLPNYLLLPLVTLTPAKNCKKDSILVHYEMDWVFGKAAYIWLLMDFATVVLAYVFFKFLMGGKIIGTCLYRLYKAYWLMTCMTSIFLFFLNLVFTFNWNIFAGLNFAFAMAIDFNVLFHYSIDMLAFMAGANTVMEALSLTYTIGGILLPVILSKIPCCKSCAGPQDKAKVAEEGRSLLAGR